MIKLLKFDNLFRHYDILAKTPSRMKTAIPFFRPNYAGYAWNLALVIQTNGTKNFGRLGENGKKVIPWRYYLITWNFGDTLI